MPGFDSYLILTCTQPMTCQVLLVGAFVPLLRDQIRHPALRTRQSGGTVGPTMVRGQGWGYVSPDMLMKHMGTRL